MLLSNERHSIHLSRFFFIFNESSVLLLLFLLLLNTVAITLVFQFLNLFVSRYSVVVFVIVTEKNIGAFVLVVFQALELYVSYFPVMFF